ncbi:hypothetical protein M407DRAFT_26311 [Tulasnella calospora MUT 4182]|uniref:F-box domain-containing protein n=1 Tax=Tulasnella calospora MUT 4182 TaxID=1051891 RepID=A0A0C3QFZ7_9AGAM|nr:hypothetical protein M407DRAFT_26311 [Tulasnella calospora MUT 4182]
MTSKPFFTTLELVSDPHDVLQQLPIIPYLPPELLGCVIYHVQCSKTLTTLAISAAILQEEAERALYRSIWIRTPEDLHSLSSALLKGKRNLGRCNSVRSLEFGLLEDECHDRNLEDFQNILSSIPNLTALRFWTRAQRRGFPLRHPITTVPYTFQLRTLGIRESDLHPDQLVQFLESQPSIEVLEMYTLSSTPDDSLDLSALSSNALPKLSKIAGRVFNVLQLVPGRPVTEVILRDWLEMARVADVGMALALSSVPACSLKCLISTVAPQFFVTMGSHVPDLVALDLEVAFSLRGYELASIASRVQNMPSLKDLTISGFRTARFAPIAPSPAEDALLFAERFALRFPSLAEFTLVSKTDIGKSADCATCVLSKTDGWSVAEEFSVADDDRSSKWKTCVVATF